MSRLVADSPQPGDPVAEALSRAGLMPMPDVGLWTDGAGLALEVKARLQSVRGLRAAILGLAGYLGRASGTRGLILLLDPSLTVPRIAGVWEEARVALRPDIADRLEVVAVTLGSSSDMGGLPPALAGAVAELLGPGRSSGDKLPRPDYFVEVLKLLLHRRFRREGAATTRWLSDAVGCSYPTTRRALDRLGPALARRSDRKVELDHFPRRAWTELVAGSERLRGAVRFADLSGQPRSPESLLRRLDRTTRPDLAVGGTIGAALVQPDLDLIGASRLDLCIHVPGDRLDLDFVAELDPALVRTADPRVSARLVVHPVRRRDALFEPRAAGVPRADVIECLLDLYEARLGAQADGLLASLERGAAT